MSIRQLLVAGLGASIVMAMWQMIVEAIIPGGTGFFGPPIAIGATLVRDLQGASNPLPLDWLAFVLGLAGHMMNSVILALIFGLVAPRFARSASGFVIAGMVWGVVVYALMWYAVVPVVDELALNLNAPAFFVAHLMWGVALGWLWHRFAAGSVPTGRLAAA